MSVVQRHGDSDGLRKGASDPSVSEVRKAARRVSGSHVQRIERSVSQAERLFGGGDTGSLLQGQFGTDRIYAWFQQRHKLTGASVVGEDGHCRVTDDDGTEHDWKVPYGVRCALDRRLIHAQMANKYPWYVTWQSPKSGKRLKKKFESLAQAILFITTRAQYVDPQASIISRIGYDIPAKLRGKLPHKRLGYWCPCCMDARRYYAAVPEQTFFAMKKVARGDGSYEFKERKLRVLKCKVCGLSNRDPKFRRSNQPWTVRRFKRGARRAKRL